MQPCRYADMQPCILQLLHTSSRAGVVENRAAGEGGGVHQLVLVLGAAAMAPLYLGTRTTGVLLF